MKSLIVIAFLCIHLSCLAQQDIIHLPAPTRTGGMPLMEALDRRASGRAFLDSSFSSQQISDVLWTAFGFNRGEGKKRTAPSAMNCQEFDLYWVDKKGVSKYMPDSNNLKIVLTGDYRAAMGKQNFVKEAAGVMVFVADYSKMGKMSDEDKDFYSAADCGYISQNVYLFAASQGLSTVVLGWIDREEMHKLLQLEMHQKIIFSQAIGYPK